MFNLGANVKILLNNFISLLREKGGRRFFLGAGLFIFIYVFLLFSIMPLGVSVELGKPSPQRIIAHKEVIDTFLTNRMREEAAAAVPAVFDYVPGVWEEGKAFLGHFFAEVKKIQNLNEDAGEKANIFHEDNPDFPLSEEQFSAFLAQKQDKLDALQAEMEKILEEILSKGIREEGQQEALNQILQKINRLPFSPEIRQGSEELLAPLVQPNMIFNTTATKTNQEAAKQAIEPVLILKKSLIVQEGEEITKKHISQLEDLGLLGSRLNYGGYAGLFFILAIVFIIVILYLYLFNKDIYDSFSALFLLGLIIAAMVVGFNSS